MKRPRLCGYCAVAPISAAGRRSHRYCPGDERCACAATSHTLPPEVREVQALYCHITVDEAKRRDGFG